MVRTNCFEELDPVRFGHVVIGDDTVDVLRPQDVHGVVGTGRRRHREPVVLTLERHRNELPEIGVVVDVEDADRVGCGRHGFRRITHP